MGRPAQTELVIELQSCLHTPNDTLRKGRRPGKSMNTRRERTQQVVTQRNRGVGVKQQQGIPPKTEITRGDWRCAGGHAEGGRECYILARANGHRRIHAVGLEWPA